MIVVAPDCMQQPWGTSSLADGLKLRMLSTGGWLQLANMHVLRPPPPVCTVSIPYPSSPLLRNCGESDGFAHESYKLDNEETTSHWQQTASCHWLLLQIAFPDPPPPRVLFPCPFAPAVNKMDQADESCGLNDEETRAYVAEIVTQQLNCPDFKLHPDQVWDNKGMGFCTRMGWL